jgi:hypothetical protein
VAASPVLPARRLPATLRLLLESSSDDEQIRPASG